MFNSKTSIVTSAADGCGKPSSIRPMDNLPILSRSRVIGVLLGSAALFAACGGAYAQNLAVLASFNGSGDGSGIYSPVTLSGDTLYGTAYNGGAYGDGTVFSVPVTGGAPNVLASFNGTDGQNPGTGVTLVGSTLYGTTYRGGANSSGVVYSLPVTGGTPTVLTSFVGGAAGAYSLSGNLVYSDGTLYGTNRLGGPYNGGTVFSLPITGGTTTLLAGLPSGGGGTPGGVILSGNMLYGVTQHAGQYNDGTVFSVPVTGGTPTILASFNGENGSQPLDTSLALSGSTLYGSTSYGGANNDGVVFSLPVLSGGVPTVLASFNGTDGTFPNAGLIVSGNTLYGTTFDGGANGGGVVFSLTPIPEPASLALLALGGVPLLIRQWPKRKYKVSRNVAQ